MIIQVWKNASALGPANLYEAYWRYWQQLPLIQAVVYYGVAPTYKETNTVVPGDAKQRHRTNLTLFQVMACSLFSAKPWPEPRLTHCQLDSMENVIIVILLIRPLMQSPEISMMILSEVMNTLMKGPLAQVNHVYNVINRDDFFASINSSIHQNRQYYYNTFTHVIDITNLICLNAI